MGKGGKITIGYWYRVAFHHGISATPIDAYLEFRAGDKTAWSGELTSSGIISINAPNLFGGEKDQGGIVGDFEVMFGDVDQQPNDYLLSVFGSQVPGWRGVTTGVFRGGRYGALNPFPQKPAHKIRAIKAGWDNDTCWYPEKAEVQVVSSTTLPPDANGWQYQVLPDEANPGFNNITVPADGWLENGQAPFGEGPANGPINTSWPNHTILWIKRTVNVASANQVLKITAENGCVVFINGALAGAVNRENVSIIHNENNSFSFPLAAGQSYEIAVKAWDETDIETGDVTYLTVEITAPGLIAMNPAHVLYEARTAQDRGAEPIESIADANWRVGADWYYSQGFGITTDFNPDAESVDDFIARIERVSGCSVNRSPIDGLWYLDIANGEYDLASLPILTDDDILDWEHTPTIPDDAVNSLSVEYEDIQQKVTVTTPPVRALALISANGLNHDVRQFHELPTGDLATRVAQRELAAGVTPTRAFSLTTTRKPYNWRRNTYFRLQAPKTIGVADMVCLLAEKSSGTLKSGAMKITAAQDIYSLPAASFAEVEPGVDTRPPQIPLGIMQQAAFEAPYIEVAGRLSRADLDALPDDIGYLMTVAKDPGVSRDYTLTVSTDGGSTYNSGTNGPWCPSALVVEGDQLTDAAPATMFTLSDGSLLDKVVLGSPALWNGEICRVGAIDVAAGTITLGRGCADTPPAIHAANERIWFYDGYAGEDTTEYTDGELIDVKLLTNTGTQQLDASLATPMSLVFSQRQFRPYPPAGLTINGLPYASSVGTAGSEVSIAFTTRNRVTQADQLVDASEADVAAEAGTTYTLRGYIETALDATLAGQAGSPILWTPSGRGTARIELVAVRDGVESNPVVHEFAYGEQLWSPADLAVAPKVWLHDGSGVVNDGTGACSQWTDASGGARHFVMPTVSQRPAITPAGQNGRQILTFDGVDNWLSGTATCAGLTNNISALSTFVVANPDVNAAAGGKRLAFFSIGTVGDTSSRASIQLANSAVGAYQRRLDADATKIASTAHASKAWRIHQSEHDWAAQTVLIRLDGGAATTTNTAQGSNNTQATNSTEVSLGGTASVAGQCIATGMGEVIVLGYIPTLDDRQRIEGYLAHRWGLEANLPADHPYKVDPP